jgi:hypothetical protein
MQISFMRMIKEKIIKLEKKKKVKKISLVL